VDPLALAPNKRAMRHRVDRMVEAIAGVGLFLLVALMLFYGAKYIGG
jgi:hypothetical protein